MLLVKLEMKQCSSRCRRRFSLPLPEYGLQDYYRMPRLRARLCPRHIGVGCFSMPARRCALVSFKTLLCKTENSQVVPSFLEKSAWRDKAKLFPPMLTSLRTNLPHQPDQEAILSVRCCLSPRSASEKPDHPERASAHIGSAIWPVEVPRRYLLPVTTSLIDPLCSGGRGAVAESEVTVCLLAEQATSQY